ncbi:hypothetical protein [Metabacillus fastidiosus]|uniref:hypothetical protein n=1 Tax=Metabacillus fastidiosus TaxID=1458 RepID=UPI000824F547|nr:hypothetical protein [Metabacillus fastidiosus]MED4461444.1 hypothetical protein [Metabacillus fastidiosus]
MRLPLQLCIKHLYIDPTYFFQHKKLRQFIISDRALQQDFVDFWLIHLQAELANAFQRELKSAQISKKEKKSSLFSPFLEI